MLAPGRGSLKTKMLLLVTVIALGMGVAGCGKIKSLIGGKPTGQVVATVNGQEITVTELNQELRGLNTRDPKIVKQAQTQALQRIIVRDLLVQQAREAKMDKTPGYTNQIRRGELDLLAQSQQQKLAQAATVPSRQDGEAFVTSHPDMFAKRQILILDQVAVGPNKIAPERFKDLKTLSEVKALFTTENLPYQENVATLDTLSTPPQMVEQISKMPADEVFIVPARGALVFNHVSETPAFRSAAIWRSPTPLICCATRMPRRSSGSSWWQC